MEKRIMIRIIDDALTLPHQEMLKRMVTDPMLPWYYNDDTIADGKNTNKNDKFQYTHNIYRNGNVFRPDMQDLLQLFTSSVPELRTHGLERAKFNMNHPWKKRDVQLPHIDSNLKGAISFFYFCIDSDGPTRLYHNWWRTQKIHPKQGRLVAIPANMLHSSNVPYKYQRRIVLNFVLVPLSSGVEVVSKGDA